METIAKKNLVFSSVILLGIFILQIVQYSLFYNMLNTIDIFFRVFGAFLTIIAIPLLISIVARIFKKKFFGAFWKSMAIISIPICVISFFGAYSEYNSDPKTPSSIVPSKYKQSNNEAKKFESEVKSQTFIKLDQINEAIKKSPTNAINYYNRGIIYTSDLQHDKAIKDYSMAIELDPNFSAAYLNRSVEYLFLNLLEKAFSDC